MSAPLFSIVIPTRDRRESLLRCLEALGRQDPGAGPFEVVVVDDGSRDGTAEAAEAPARPFPLRVLRRGAPGGPCAARNEGAAAAAGEFLAFLDDDVVPRRDWLPRARERIGSGDLDLLAGAYATAGSGSPLPRGGDPSAVPFLGGNLFVRRSLFERVGGFDPAFHDPATGLFLRDDSDLAFRVLDAGARWAGDPGVVVEHPPPFPRFGDCVRHARRSVFDPLLLRRHPRRFRDGIEVKRILGLRLRRPLHRAALAHGALLAAAGAALALGAPVAAAACGSGALAAALVFRARYRPGLLPSLRGLAELPGFAILPAVHLAAILRGCVRHRDFRALL